MNRQIIFAVSAMLVMFAGCSKQASLVAYNRTGTELTISDVDGNLHALKAGERLEITFFGLGVRFQVTKAGERYSYVASQYPPREFRGKQYPYDVVVAFKEDMAIYACHPDGREVVDQPEGFPLKPSK